MGLKDLADRLRAARDYFPNATLESVALVLSDKPTLPAIGPLPSVEDFAPDDFVPEVALPRSADCERLTGQEALEIWAAQTKSTREGKLPAIHRHSNVALRDKHLREVRCPNCGCEFEG